MNEPHEVHFDFFCPKCVHWGESEWDEPCNSCLNEPANYDSRRPLYFQQDPEKEEALHDEKAHGQPDV